MSSKSDCIQVLVRIRPLLVSGAGNVENESIVDLQSGTELEVRTGDGKKAFQCMFDSILGPTTSQSDVYKTVQSCTRSVLEGFNATIFAYGQTGSGKTYSMYGPPMRGADASFDSWLPGRLPEQLGVIPRAIIDVFSSWEERSAGQLDFNVYCSFVQIYNESLYDMLRDSSMMNPLNIREDPAGEIFIDGLAEYRVRNADEALQLLQVAETNRAMRETHMNLYSSRSHSIFQLIVEQKRLSEDGGEVRLRAKYNLVDLAGSEKWNVLQRLRDEHISEMTNINLSLHTLGRCISALAQSARAAKNVAMSGVFGPPTISTVGSRKDNQSMTTYGIHVPYRESKLTRLLQDSLGGNSLTFLIATVSPSRTNADETISTLKFADRAKDVMVRAVANASRPVDHVLVNRLQRYAMDEMDEYAAQAQIIQILSKFRRFAIPDSLIALNPENNSVAAMARSFSQSSFKAVARSVEDVDHPGDTNIKETAVTSTTVASSENVVSNIDSVSLVTHQGRRRRQQRLSHTSYSAGGDSPKSADTTHLGVVLSPNVISGAIECFATQDNSDEAMWTMLDKFQSIMNKYFRYQIEEDVMNAEVTALFHKLDALRKGRKMVIDRRNELIDALKTAINGKGQLPPNISYQATEVIASSASIKKAKQAQEQQQQNAAYDTNSNNRTRLEHLQVVTSAATAHSSPGRDEGTNYKKHDISQYGIGSSSSGSNSDNNVASAFSRQQRLSAPPPSLYQDHIPLGQHHLSPLPNASVAQLLTSSSSQSRSAPSAYTGIAAQLTPIKRQQQQQRQHQVTGSVPYRVTSSKVRQGSDSYSIESGNVRGGTNKLEWTVDQPPSAEEIERQVQRELAQAKHKLKKHHDLQDWLQVKEQQLGEAEKIEEEKRAALREEVQQREIRRQEHARKQKQKLIDYQTQIKTEAEKIRDLKELGIDPKSIFS